MHLSSPDVPPVLAEIILSPPEVVMIDRVLTGVLERYGLPNHLPMYSGDVVDLGALSGVREQWQEHVRRLSVDTCGVQVDGIGLLAVTLPLTDIVILVVILKSVGLDAAIDPELLIDQQERQMLAELIVRFESQL
jgi:hypothetical protein